MRELLRERMLHREGLAVAAVVTQEERKSRSRLNTGDHALRRRDPQHVQSLLLVASPTPAIPTIMRTMRGRLANRKLLNSNGHVRIGVVWIDLQYGFRVPASGQALTGSSEE